MSGPAPEQKIASQRRQRLLAVLRVVSGNFLEMYDFFVFGYYAAAIGRAYFPESSEFASLMLSLATFGVGFLMRPLGALILGAYVDRHGRRAGLLLTLGLMSIGTLSIALCPGYRTLGLLAPLIVVAGRLLQGFSAGVELAGVSVYLFEISPPGRRGFYVSWQSASQQLAVVLVALLGVLLSRLLRPEELDHWGWRIPFLVGCTIVPLLFMIRRSLEETAEFRRRGPPPPLPELLETLLRSWRLVLLGLLLVTTSTVCFYFITAYTPTFGREVLRLSLGTSLLVTLCVGLANLTWLPLFGSLSDRLGRLPLLITAALLCLATAYPALRWLAAAPSFSRLLLVELWLSLLYGCYNAALVVYLTELMPSALRTVGFSLAYSLATALFGGFTPVLCTYLIQRTSDQAAPGLWLTFAAACGLGGALVARRRELAGANHALDAAAHSQQR